MVEKKRLDVFLVEKGYFSTRSRARDAIARQTIAINGQIIIKAGQVVADDCVVEIDDKARQYVSRAALKLLEALETFPVKTKNITALDIGASTGGFTQVLLEKGAAHIIAVDVGHGQLHESLKNNDKITLLEGLNVRNLEQAHLNGHALDLIVSDVSFISLKLALPNALMLAKAGAQAILLVKPQFEAGRENIGKGGLLKDQALGEIIAKDLFDWLNKFENWQAKALIPSPIQGGDGNREYLLFGEKNHA